MDSVEIRAGVLSEIGLSKLNQERVSNVPTLNVRQGSSSDVLDRQSDKEISEEEDKENLPPTGEILDAMKRRQAELERSMQSCDSILVLLDELKQLKVSKSRFISQ